MGSFSEWRLYRVYAGKTDPVAHWKQEYNRRLPASATDR